MVSNIVNPTSFLSDNIGKPVHHNYLENIEEKYSNQTDLKDNPMENTENCFMDESSNILNSERHPGYAITTSHELMESGPLPKSISAQKAVIIALICALELAVNFYTDSKYAFRIVLAHRTIWKENGLLNSQGKHIKNAEEILAAQLPKKVAITHIKAHQKVSSALEKENELVERQAKLVFKQKVKVQSALVPDRQVTLERKPEYIKEDRKRIIDFNESYNEEGWANSPQGKLIVTSYLV
ncbi:hypothetical protein AV530_017748 [Patagioenas fasciata monilis]|uniref:RNase H type-1 domain-containing protein n=1 Tax=Patagioenas fasciata monilis TaxID=372326 RepID=A0A1V4K1D8_PATFA|nr:hypothetical protein AV530_017748 [Patagioenas fasciata monilis]